MTPTTIPNTRVLRPRFALALMLLIIPSWAAAEPPKRILFIGNSYTGQIRSELQSFVKASPHQSADLEFIHPGGKTLMFHADQAKTIKRIREGKWDIVVLQDQSQTPAVAPKRFLEAAKSLHNVMTESGARTAYYETWGRRDGDKKNQEQFPTYEIMQDALSDTYAKAAKRDNAILVPVGTAWRHIRHQHPSLGKALYKADGSHPSSAGAYVAAICFYASLFDDDPNEVGFTNDLSADVANKIRSAATESIQLSR